MTDDFEGRLAELLNESVDAQLGSKPAAPPFDPPAEADPADELAARRRRRYTFLALAATVVAVLIAAFAVHAVTPDDRHHQKPVAPPPELKSVHLGGATIALPEHWVARNLKAYGQAGSSPGWCLTPASTPVRTSSIFDCPIRFTAFDGSGPATLDPDVQGGFFGDPSQALQCFPTASYRIAEQAGRQGFGGRQAEFRQFIVTCPKKPAASYTERQYVVATPRGYVLNAYRTTPAIRAALATILKHSTLPKPIHGGVRLADLGYVRSVRSSSAGEVIRIQRATAEHQEGQRPVVTQGTRTHRYVIPPGVADEHIGTGDLVYLATDGKKVTVLYHQ